MRHARQQALGLCQKEGEEFAPQCIILMMLALIECKNAHSQAFCDRNVKMHDRA
ncbi:hypothetical protein [Bradyrhizobium sp. UFLA05-112]